MKQLKIKENNVNWIVNDLGELGVEISGKCFFLYKGESLQYSDAKHEDGSDMLYRRVGKREFGETQWPLKWTAKGSREERYREEVSKNPGLDSPHNRDVYEWKPLPKSRPR